MSTFASLCTKKARVAFIREKLATDKVWAIRALCVIHANQTADEQQAGVTEEDNGIGFTGLDAAFLTSLYNSYMRNRSLGRGDLSDKQLLHLHKLMPKYAGQLERISAPHIPSLSTKAA